MRVGDVRAVGALPGGAGDRREQLTGVVVVGILEHARDRTALDLHAAPQHRHGVGDLPHHGEVVGDEHVGQPQLVLQPGEEPQDLRLHGWRMSARAIATR